MKQNVSFVLLSLLLTAPASLAEESKAETAEIAEQAPSKGQDRAAREQEIAQLNAAIKASAKDYDNLPKRKFISPSTTEPRYQAYMAEWVRHIEKIGNQHYPEQARELNLSGEVVVMVEVGRNGELLKMNIVRSSGSKVLDDAALTITQIASPFQPIPSADAVQILSITRTWKFVADRPLAIPNVPSRR